MFVYPPLLSRLLVFISVHSGNSMCSSHGVSEEDIVPRNMQTEQQCSIQGSGPNHKVGKTNQIGYAGIVKEGSSILQKYLCLPVSSSATMSHHQQLARAKHYLVHNNRVLTMFCVNNPCLEPSISVTG